MHGAADLFPDPDWRVAPREVPLLRSPLGALTTGADVGDLRLAPDTAARLLHPGGAERWVWQSAAVRAELVLAAPAVALPPGMRVDGCRAAAWRFRAAAPCAATIVCAWDELPGGVAGAWESGENLEAQAWYGAGIQVSLGTPDLGEATEYRPDGFLVRLQLTPGAVGAVHFVVAWSPDRSDDDSAWFAVDCTPQQVLASLDAPAS
jgi:hypothetical protein